MIYMKDTTKKIIGAIFNKEVCIYLILAPIVGAIISYLCIISISQEITAEIAYVIVSGVFLCVFASNVVAYFGTRDTN